MEEFSGTKQSTKYIWRARKPLQVLGGRAVKQGETFTPTEEMITAFGDLMVRASASAQFDAADAKIAAAKDEMAKAEAEKADAKAKAEADAVTERAEAEAKRAEEADAERQGAQAKRATPEPTPAQPKRPGSRE